MEYKYKIINNHYLVEINNLIFLLDTGLPTSFSFDSLASKLYINDVAYNIPVNTSSPKEIFETIGTKVDGFIGLDILRKTSLTIIKDNDASGIIIFGLEPFNGTSIDLKKKMSYYCFDVIVDGKQYDYCIDLGAKITYFDEDYINPIVKKDFKTDYNPILGHLYSDEYLLNIELNKEKYEIKACSNKIVTNNVLKMLDCGLIGSITDFIKHKCVIDFNNNKMII